MKQIASFNLLSVILCIGLAASLILNVYQLYSHNDGWLHDAEAQQTEVETSQLQQQLLICHRESTRKDSVIAVLTHDASINPYRALSAHCSP